MSSRTERGKIIDSEVAELAEESREILSSPARVGDLACRRFALRCVQLKEHFENNVFRLGVVGNPNRGKTTYAYSCYRNLKLFHFPSSYTELDIYSPSGEAIAGRIGWNERIIRSTANEEEVRQSINEYLKVSKGIAIADFPGRPENPYQPDRLGELDLALILGSNIKDQEKWRQVVSSVGVSWTWLNTRLNPGPRLQINPTIYGLRREPKPFALDIIVSLTRILEIAAEMNGVPLVDIYEEYPGEFSEAERVVLEETLDFEFAPIV